MRLGTLPIVAPTGGLKDTVEAGDASATFPHRWGGSICLECERMVSTEFGLMKR